MALEFNTKELPAELEHFSSKKQSALRELSKVISEKVMRKAAQDAKPFIDDMFNNTEPRLFHDFKG